MPGRTTAKTELFSSWQTGGLVIADQGLSTGGRVWVHSGTGFDTTGYGLAPDKPCATLNRAVAVATASKYDVIYVMPGHVETISTAALSPTLSKIGLKVQGLGEGELRPKFTITHVDGNVIFSAASCALRNVILEAGVDSVVEAIDLNCTDAIVEYCEIREGSAMQFLTGIDITGAGANAADRCIVKHNKIVSEAAGAVNGIQISQVQDGLVIEDNWITGDFSEAPIWSDQINTNAMVKDNRCRNVNAADFAIEFTGATTGMCVGNRLMSNAVATALDPGSMMCLDNKWVGAIDQGSIEVPVASAGVLPAGSIDAAAIANDAIDATAIANAAIDAATFAAGAIDAAAIANAAIDAATFANDTMVRLWMGETVTHTDVILGAGDTAAFNIAGGYVLVLGIWGEVSTVVQGAATTTQLMYTDTTGAVQYPLCATSDLTGDTVGTHVALAGGPVATVLTEGVACMLSTPLILHTGHLDVAQGGGANTGAIDWTVRWLPITVGATVTAA